MHQVLPDTKLESGNVGKWRFACRCWAFRNKGPCSRLEPEKTELPDIELPVYSAANEIIVYFQVHLFRQFLSVNLQFRFRFLFPFGSFLGCDTGT